jgi:hypothetical protein
MTQGTTADEKIRQAKELLIAATRQRRKEYQLARARDVCQCGHSRQRHTVTASVNYTQGLCMVKGCACFWFQMSEAGG